MSVHLAQLVRKYVSHTAPKARGTGDRGVRSVIDLCAAIETRAEAPRVDARCVQGLQLGEEPGVARIHHVS